MKLVGKITLWVLTWPVFLGWLWPLFCECITASAGITLKGGIMQTVWRPWVIKPRRWLAVIRWPFGQKGIHNGVEMRSLWKYSTTLAAGMVLQPGASERTMKHEGVHVRQCRGLVLLGLVLGIVVALDTGDWWWLPKLWLPGGLALYKLPNFLVPLLEGGHVYRDSEHERSAYAQTDTREGGSSWLDEHLKRPQSW